jgi:hypothetical protein
MFPAMAADTKTLDPGIAERERVIRTIRAHAAEVRARGVTHLRLFGRELRRATAKTCGTSGRCQLTKLPRG